MSSTFLQLWPSYVLMLALLLAWRGWLQAALVLLPIVGIGALAAGYISYGGMGALIVGLVAAAGSARLTGRWRGLRHLFLILWSVLLWGHFLPGVSNPLVLDQLHTGPLSGPYSMYLNFDKPLVLFVLLLGQPWLLEPVAALRLRPVIWALGGLVALFPLAMGLGALKVEISWPVWAPLFMLNNLLMVSLVEEAFFRGYMQRHLIARLGAGGGIILAGILFGIVHFASGPVVVGFAALLGIVCGMGYYFGGRLSIAIGMHFAFNATHLVFFTYPIAL